MSRGGGLGDPPFVRWVSGAGTATAFINLKKASTPVTYGDFTLEIVGVYAVADPDTLDSDSLSGRMVTLAVAQLTRK